MTNQDFSIKYRPQNFDEVIGQDIVIESLQNLIKTDKKLPACLLFVGFSGCGKTSTARLCARSINCSENNIIEIDGASNNGIDQMRALMDSLKYNPFGSKSRMVIIDEAQRVTGAAFDALLKTIEEPPTGTTFILCSTNPEKIPNTIKTRAHVYEFKKVDVSKIRELLAKVVEKEALKTEKKVINYLSIKSEGSPRRALVYLSMARDLPFDKVQELIKSIGTAEGSPATLELCRALVKHCSWNEAVSLLKAIEDEPETIRLTVLAYFSKVILNAKNVDDVKYGLTILHAFSNPTNPSEKLAPIILALGTIID